MRKTNIGIILVIVIAGIVGAFVLYKSGEIDMHQYRTLRNGFKQGTIEYRMAIADAMRNGEVSRREYENLMMQFEALNRDLPVDFNASNLREERLVLAAMTRQLQGR